MFGKHEYSVVGHSRVDMGRYLGIIAGALSSLLATAIAATVALAAAEGITLGSKLILPATSTLFYAIGYYLFDRHAWKWSWVQRIFNIPWLGGDWACSGKTFDEEGNVTYNWEAKITIVQHWEKISVQIQTAQSRSYSVAASIIKNDNAGPILMYSYRNEPRMGEPELKAHFGYSEWHFSSDLKTASASYVNGGGRRTSGIMDITKVEQ
ncbi:pancortin-3 [Comamonas testosteroni]|uniref:Cap15 family cyclic dinucleotide receptor domain-containing protein n=1 Tax=Comamonas testosteroni TaxID=285 RepID=UPI0012FF1287|nr:pancortin-3 [Comamonas testosteroni]